MRKNTALFILSVCAAILFFGFSMAIAWEHIPVMAGSEKIREQESTVNNRVVRIMIFKIAGTGQDAIDFYKPKFINLGWQLTFEQIQQGVAFAGFSKKSSFINFSVQKVQRDNYLTITQGEFVGKSPENNDGKTTPCSTCSDSMGKFSKLSVKQQDEYMQNQQIKAEDPLKHLSEITGKSVEQLQKEAGVSNIISSKADVPGEDLSFVPRYPGSRRVSSIVTDFPKKKVFLTYHSEDAGQRIEDFYKINMERYGWKSTGEIDLNNLPSQAENVLATIDLESSAGFLFEGPYGKCLITITEVPDKDSGTIIGVKYDGK